MTLIDRAVYAIAVILAMLIAGYAVAYWWTSRVPGRPPGVRADAVFLWAPAVGLPAPRRGDWLACWRENQLILCEMNHIDGAPEYKGEFVPYARSRPTSTIALKIDTSKSGENKVWVGHALVPLVFLEGGEVLIPASKYEEGVKLLDGGRIK